MKKDAGRAGGQWNVDSHIEDRALKLAAMFFGTELFPLMGITGRVRRPAPTEQIHLEVKDFNEDRLVETLVAKQKTGALERDELVSLLLAPLMAGDMPQKDRIAKGMKLLQKANGNLEEEDLRRMEAVLYAFALKFLKKLPMHSRYFSCELIGKAFVLV